MSKAKKKNETIEFVEGSGNVYADLRLPNPEQMRAKAALMHEINAEIKRRGLTQEEAGQLIGMAQSDVSNISRGRGRGYSMERLCEVLHELGVGSTLHLEGEAVHAEIPVYAHA